MRCSGSGLLFAGWPFLKLGSMEVGEINTPLAVQTRSNKLPEVFIYYLFFQRCWDSLWKVAGMDRIRKQRIWRAIEVERCRDKAGRQRGFGRVQRPDAANPRMLGKTGGRCAGALLSDWNSKVLFSYMRLWQGLQRCLLFSRNTAATQTRDTPL